VSRGVLINEQTLEGKWGKLIIARIAWLAVDGSDELMSLEVVDRAADGCIGFSESLREGAL
jgi:hypothetical protein